MTLVATTRALVGNPANLAYIFGQKFDSRTTLSGTPIVFSIGNDHSEQEWLEAIITCQGWEFETFDSASEFLARPRPQVPSCLILNVALPDLGDLELQRRIAKERIEIPIIFVTSFGDVRTTVEAMKAGAVEFLMKPFKNEALFSAIREGLERSRVALHREVQVRELQNCYASLTRRERQVMSLIVSGLLNKQVGGELGISEVTVKVHRGQVMHKMKADSFAQLVVMSTRLRAACSTNPASVLQAPARLEVVS